MKKIFVLKLNNGGHGFFLTLSEGVNDLGRAKSCRLQVQHHSVSRSHARLMNTGESVWLDDLESSNGTFVNDRPVENGNSIHLVVGDVVRFGEVEFRLTQEASRPDARMTEAIEFVASIREGSRPEDEVTGPIAAK